jgi:hypothetical protein
MIGFKQIEFFDHTPCGVEAGSLSPSAPHLLLAHAITEQAQIHPDPTQMIGKTGIPTSLVAMLLDG